ncbi:hypothetical protein DP113_04255 [Brasilonema octagenarum UFV-E1]|uniref:Uncharacterized protein n=1 Tax=Brasilonema sennae CENA114 TaxID=415709 RepID=A0A856M7W4_9CYAN|nr:hypothetical protein DP114_04305 [Brasilonema sennae CENA114]QDL13596.1 hypothetical protein DP113_04255 [Brasilonema octagenarum UFV-E1]
MRLVQEIGKVANPLASLARVPLGLSVPAGHRAVSVTNASASLQEFGGLANPEGGFLRKRKAQAIMRSP